MQPAKTEITTTLIAIPIPTTTTATTTLILMLCPNNVDEAFHNQHHHVVELTTTPTPTIPILPREDEAEEAILTMHAHTKRNHITRKNAACKREADSSDVFRVKDLFLSKES